MTVALILLAAIVGVGALLWFLDRRHKGTDAEAAPNVEVPAECCGQHEVCERDSLLAAVSKQIEYYDDEELDHFAGRGADEYSDEEIEEFRDVLLTLRSDDIAGWARSIQLRGIKLPAAVREELIMMVSENRAMHQSNVAVS